MENVFKNVFDDTRPELQPGYYKIYEADLESKSLNNDDSKAVIIMSGIANDDPIELLDSVKNEYVGDEYRQYNEFVDCSFDNIWVRVLIKNIGNLKFEKFDPEKHRL
jgi:hypothetical protein